MAVHGGGITFDARGRRRESRLKVLAVQESHPYARKVKTKQRIFYLGKYCIVVYLYFSIVWVYVCIELYGNSRSRWMNILKCENMYVCKVCMYVCMYVCIYVCIYVYIYVFC